MNFVGEYVRKGQESKLLKRKASTVEVEEYASCFIEILIKLYPEIRTGETLSENGLIGKIFFFGKSPRGEFITSSQLATLKPIIEKDEHKSLRRIRIMRYYDGNAFVLIKPDRLRYWIKSVALRDADDVIADLVKMGGF